MREKEGMRGGGRRGEGRQEKTRQEKRCFAYVNFLKSICYSLHMLVTDKE